MKRFFLGLLFVSIFLLLSCDDSVSIKSEYKEDYAVFCVLNCDTTFHTAYVNKSFDVEMLEPNGNTTDPAVTNAEVSINIGQNNYAFKDTSVERITNLKYQGKFHFYANTNLSLKSNGINDVPKPVSISVKMPDSKILSCNAFTIPSGGIYFDTFPYVFPVIGTAKSCEFRWRFFSINNNIRDYYFIPTLEIDYSKTINGVLTRMKFAIPYKKEPDGNNEVPVYSSLTNYPYVYFLKEYINEAFNKLSEGDPDKQNYTIHNLTLKVIIMDKAAASYYAADKTFNDEFSVRIEAAEVSNISGGYGVFGLYATRFKKIKVDSNFVYDSGYNYKEK